MKTFLIILIIVAAIFEALMARRLRRRETALEERIKYVDSREEEAREAMRRNGETEKALNEKREMLDERAAAIDERNYESLKTAEKNVQFATAVRKEMEDFKDFKKAIGVVASYKVSDKDRESYSEESIPAVVKSRIANKLGHAILRRFPDSLHVEDGDVYVAVVYVKLKPDTEK